ncbi:MAG: S-layer homology domain-containing protein [Thermoleophilia bacterium]|nr:S-layer homology domain-containing protein [Thermoleophilia bacterium]
MRRSLRIIMGLLLAMVLVLGIAIPASAAPEFSDIEDHDYEASIVNLVARYFVGGYPDGTFRPDNLLQRQQFAKMAVLTLDYEVTATDVSTFKDTPAPYDPVNNPLYPGSYVAVAATKGIIQGYTNGNFGFTDNVTRQQVITIAVRAAGEALDEAPAEYAGVLDYTNANHGANVKKAEYNGLLAGIADLATWDLTANATRGEAAEILSQVFYRVGNIIKVGGPSGNFQYTMADLKEMTATEGYGGWKNKLGNITAPALYKGVALKDLVTLMGTGTTLTVFATDGYELEFTAEELDGQFTVYNTETGEEITDYAGTVTPVLAYSVDGSPLASSNGALRIALVSEEADQVTDSKKWVGQLIGILVQ